MDRGELKAISQAAARVHQRFPEIQEDAVKAVVDRLHRQYAQSRIRAYIPILVEREAMDHFRGRLSP
jgi:hypothetical protein